MDKRWPLLLLLLAAPALAYRPFDGTDADVAQHGEMELEMSPFGYVNTGAHAALTVPSLVINYGFARGFEIVLEGRDTVSLTATSASRIQLEDTALSVKWLLRRGSLHDGVGPSVAVEASVLLPTTTQLTAGAELAAIVSQQWRNLTLHLNVAGVLTRERDAALFVGLIGEGPARWRVRPVSEVYVEQALSSTNEVSGLVGAIWAINDHLAIDFAGRASRIAERTQAATSLEVRAGITWAFAVRRGRGD
ncbi:MAG TPA: hypothetical protein VGH63_02000 [Polyangia bacterium]